MTWMIVAGRAFKWLAVVVVFDPVEGLVGPVEAFLDLHLAYRNSANRLNRFNRSSHLLNRGSRCSRSLQATATQPLLPPLLTNLNLAADPRIYFQG